MVVAMLLPSRIAHILAPDPRWPTMTRLRLWIVLRQRPVDVVVGSAMEAPVPNALVAHRLRHGVELRDFGHRAMEGGVELNWTPFVGPRGVEFKV